MNVIETNGLTKYYGKSRGIIDLSLSVEQGDFFGFIGPNGSGKSTTIRALLGLITPTSGSALVFGKDCVKDKLEILSNVGYVPSEAMFYSGMRVDEIIALSAKLYKKDCSKKASELCERLSVDTKKKVDELSLGNRRKVSIVCAMQHEPSLYVLDEATSGLDPLMQNEFFSLLNECNAAGATVFLSSHVLSEIQRYCRHAGVVREGKLITVRTVEEITKSSAKRVILHGVAETPKIEGIYDITTNDDHVSFLYSGEMKRLIESLVELPIIDMTVTEPDLDETFMHFYGGEIK